MAIDHELNFSFATSELAKYLKQWLTAHEDLNAILWSLPIIEGKITSEDMVWSIFDRLFTPKKYFSIGEIEVMRRLSCIDITPYLSKVSDEEKGRFLEYITYNRDKTVANLDWMKIVRKQLSTSEDINLSDPSHPLSSTVEKRTAEEKEIDKEIWRWNDIIKEYESILDKVKMSFTREEPMPLSRKDSRGDQSKKNILKIYELCHPDIIEQFEIYKSSEHWEIFRNLYSNLRALAQQLYFSGRADDKLAVLLEVLTHHQIWKRETKAERSQTFSKDEINRKRIEAERTAAEDTQRAKDQLHAFYRAKKIDEERVANAREQAKEEQIKKYLKYAPDSAKKYFRTLNPSKQKAMMKVIRYRDINSIDICEDWKIVFTFSPDGFVVKFTVTGLQNHIKKHNILVPDKATYEKVLQLMPDSDYIINKEGGKLQSDGNFISESETSGIDLVNMLGLMWDTYHYWSDFLTSDGYVLSVQIDYNKVKGIKIMKADEKDLYKVQTLAKESNYRSYAQDILDILNAEIWSVA